MGEEIKQATIESTTNFGKYLYNVQNSYLTKTRLLQMNRFQNYFQFRSAQHQQQISNHSTKAFLNTKKITTINNISQLYMKDRTNHDGEERKQEYNRYRYATSNSTTKKHPILFPCYSQLKQYNENEYSKYRDSRSTRYDYKHRYHIKIHTKCRSLLYDNTISRFPVPDTKVLWSILFADYTPVEYTTDRILRNPRADPSDPSKIQTFNEIDGKIDRRSFTGVYYVDPITNRPRNPIGRTGVTGRGRLYYWGPNHAGDPVVTRWLRDENAKIIYRQNHPRELLKPVLEFVAIRRQDTKQWALPGGMVDPGEHVSLTIKREFQEEAMKDGGEKSCIDQLFANGYKLYEHYIDDPRNTDNAWIETVAVHFHDETGQLTKNLHLNAGDDAEKVVWCSIGQHLELYACHKNIIKVVVDRLNAFW